MADNMVLVKEKEGPQVKVYAALTGDKELGVKLGIPAGDLANPEVDGINLLFLECAHWTMELRVKGLKLTAPGDFIHCGNCKVALENAVFRHKPPIEEELPQLDHHREVFDRQEAERLEARAAAKSLKHAANYHNKHYEYYNEDGARIDPREKPDKIHRVVEYKKKEEEDTDDDDDWLRD